MLKTLLLQEYGEYTSLKTAGDSLNVSKEELWNLILSSMKKLSLAYPGQGFIQTKGMDRFRFAGIAGVLALNAKIHIEIVPKFLSDSNNSWKDDFLFLAVLTNNGHLFEKQLHRASGSSNDLYEIIARIWIEKFERNLRKIIKTYIKTSWIDFLLDGDTDEENILLPTSEGFLQSGLKLSRANRHNETLLRSCVVLLNKIKKPELVGRLTRAKTILENALHEPYSGRNKRINISRNNNWADLLRLADLLIKSKSLSYFNSGHALMPGFIVQTDKLWERLLLRTAKKALPEVAVIKSGYQIGQRIYRNDSTGNIIATPDLSIYFDEGIFLADAKYKVVADEQNTSRNAVISSSDFYESLAFMQSTGTNSLLLLYPQAGAVNANPFANQPVERITSGDKIIVAVSLGMIGIAGQNGYKKFAENLRAIIENARLEVKPVV